MANRVTTLKTHVLLAGGSTRVTTLKLSAFAAISDPAVRATTLKLSAFTNDKTHGVRATTLKVGVYADDKTHGVRATTLRLSGWFSLDQAIKLGPPFGSNEVFVPADISTQASYQTPPPPVIEVNPYRADVPNVDQQRILREQHNLIQAGDSTFHWGVLTEVYASANYTLGSLGRFFHDDLGMIHARFVKFTKLTQGAAAGFPVGLDLASKSKWVVTNQFDRSSPDWIVGIALPYNQLAFEGDCFGWVIVDGFVPVELEVENDSTGFLFGTEYGWASTGKVHVNSGGDSLGTRRTTSQAPNLRVGEFYVEVKDLSLARLQGIISAAQAPLSSQIDSLTAKVDQLSSGLDSTNQNLSALTTQVSNLDSRVTREVENINNSLAAIRRLMPDGDYKSYVDSKIEGLRNDLGQQIGLVSQVSNDALLRANEAYALAQSISYEGIQVQIDALNDSMGGITDRLIGFTAVIDTNALTAGQILVATDAGLTPGGQPLLTWNPVDPTLELMKDIDWTTPPTDGQVIAWDDVAGEFKFVDQSGGGGGGGISDAPSDGTLYGRKNAAWAAVPGGGGGSAITWANGCGERRFLIQATASGGSSGAPGNSLGVGPINNFYWSANSATKTLVFDFQSAIVLHGFAVMQDLSTAGVSWTIAGSNDNSTYTDIITDFQWGGTPYGPNGFVAGNLYAREFSNSTAYRYYRLRSNTGSTNDRWVQWFGFKSEPIN